MPKLSTLPLTTTLDDDDEFYVNDTGVSRRIKTARLRAVISTRFRVDDYAGSAPGATATVDTAALVAAFAAASAAGGGIVELSPNTSYKINSDEAEIPSLVFLDGHGASSKLIKQTAGTLLTTVGYNDAPTAGHTGVYSYGLHNLVIDGNGLGGDGLRTFGSDHHVDNIRIVDNLGQGWRGRYGLASAWGFNPDQAGLSGWTGKIWLAENLGGNLDWDGPHDSTFGAVIAVMAAAARGSIPWNVNIDSNGASEFHSLHAWGNSVATAIRMAGDGHAVAQMYAEGATEIQLDLIGGNSRIHGSWQCFPNDVDELPIGIKCNGSSNVFSGTFQNCYGGAIVNAGGSSRSLTAVGWESPIDTATMDASDVISYSALSAGGAVASGGQLPAHVQLPVPSGAVAISAGSIVNTDLRTSINNQTGATYTFALGDELNRFVQGISATPQTFTIPAGVFPDGAVLNVCQLGAGAITIIPAVGVDVYSRTNLFATQGLQSQIRLRQRYVDGWVLDGIDTDTNTGLAVSQIDNTDSPYTTTDGEVVVVDSSVGAVTVNLPAAAAGLTVRVKRLTTGFDVTIDGNGAETIDGAATIDLTTQWEAVTLGSTATEWLIL